MFWLNVNNLQAPISELRLILAHMKTRMNVCNQGEADFFLGHIKKNHRVLEYGSGGSTLDIAELAGSVVSVEHDKEQFEKLSHQAPENVLLYFEPPTQETIPGHDGSRAEFANYIDIPLDYAHKHGRFDIILIHGRARVACAEICERLGHAQTLVFIQDYNHPNPEYTRIEYFDAEKHLTRLDGHFTMWKFVITALQQAPVEVPEEKTEVSESGNNTEENTPTPSSHSAGEPKKKASSKGSLDSKAPKAEKVKPAKAVKPTTPSKKLGKKK